KGLALDPRDFAPEAALGHMLAHDVAIGGRARLRKGHTITDADLATLREADNSQLRLIALEEGEIPEADAAQRLANAVAGAQVRIEGPVEGRYNLVAAVRGLLRLDAAALQALNELDDVSIFTRYDGQTVEPGDTLAGV